jgi:hypothetical protein
MTNDKVMDRHKVFSLLKARNIVKVEVQYSGGNDEGSVNQINLIDNAGKVEYMEEYYDNYSVWDETTKSYRSPEPPTKEQLLSKSLCAPVYDKYYSFAGEFYVSGTVTWDVVAGTVKDHGVEEVSHNEDYDDDL